MESVDRPVQATQPESVDALHSADRIRIKEQIRDVREFTDIQYVPGKYDRVGYFPNLEDLMGHPVLARFTYGKDSPNMSAVFFDTSLDPAEGKRRGEENTQNFLRENGFDENTIQVLGKFEGNEAQIEEVDKDTLKEKQKAVGNVIFTRDSDVTLTIKPADCPTGVLYCKDEHGNDVVAIIHGGAEAINAGMTRQGLTALQLELGIDLKSAKLGIFPGVSEKDYYITRQWSAGGEVKRRAIYPINWDEFVSQAQTDNPEEKRYVDILSAFEMQALEAGMLPENIEAYRRNTYEDAANGIAYSRRYSGVHNGEHNGGNLIAAKLNPKSAETKLSELPTAA